MNGYVVGKVFRHRLEEPVDGTAGMAIVVDRNNGWATPDPVKSQEFPILRLKCYADPDRDAQGQIARLNAEDKAWALYRAADRLVHAAQRGARVGAIGADPGLMVVASSRSKEPALVTEKDRHGVTAGDPLGDSVYVVAEYNLIVVH